MTNWYNIHPKVAWSAIGGALYTLFTVELTRHGVWSPSPEESVALGVLVAAAFGYGAPGSPTGPPPAPAAVTEPIAAGVEVPPPPAKDPGPPLTASTVVPTGAPTLAQKIATLTAERDDVQAQIDALRNVQST
jgi:peptidoglycan/LPS O-acetylase OafA/YrhL